MTPPDLLLVIDVQQGLDNPALGQRNNPQAETNIARLQANWRKNSLPIVHIRHNSTEPGSALRPELAGNAFKPATAPLAGEKQFGKTVNSAFIGTGLDEYLRENGIKTLVVVGLTTDHCVSTTVRMASNLGFQVKLVADATATFERTGHNGVHYSADEMHDINLASLHQEFCQVLTTEEILKAHG